MIFTTFESLVSYVSNTLNKEIKLSGFPQYDKSLAIRIVLADNNLKDKETSIIIDLILAKEVMLKFPLVLNFTGNKFGIKGVKKFAELIESGKLPAGSTLILSHIDVGDEGVNLLVKALKSKKCPNGLTLELVDCNICDKGGRQLLKLFSEGKFPSGGSINFTLNRLSPELLIELQNVKNPLGIHAGSIQFSSREERELRQNPAKVTLIVDKVVNQITYNTENYGLHIDLAKENIGDEEAVVIANAIKSLDHPLTAKKFVLDLRYNNLTDIGARALAEALTSGNLPERTVIQIPYNPRITDVGATSLKAAFLCSTSPSFINLILIGTGISETLLQDLTSLSENRAMGIFFLEALTINRETFIPAGVVGIMLSYLTESASLNAINSHQALSIATDKMQQLEKPNTTCLLKFGFLSKQMTGSSWLKLLTGSLAIHGVTEVQAETNPNRLIMFFKNKEDKLEFIKANDLPSEGILNKFQNKSSSNRLVISDVNNIIHILHSYARMDITMIFPEEGARLGLEFKRD